MGLSRGARTYCQQLGELIPLDVGQLPELNSQKEGWFKKPFAFLHTPFEKTLWLDCDCEVIRPFDELFEFQTEVCLAPDTENSHVKELELGTIVKGETLYNSGVILYNKDATLIRDWAKAVTDQKKAFFSDQHILSRLIHSGSYSVERLADEYNWRMSQGFNMNAVIIHWAGSWGKTYIQNRGGLGQELRALPRI